MRKLTKAQWVTILITVVSSVFALLLSDANVFGLDIKWISLIGILKMAWDLYLSFSSQDVANFANELRLNPNAKKTYLKPNDVKLWAKHVGTRPKDPPGGGGDEVENGG